MIDKFINILKDNHTNIQKESKNIVCAKYNGTIYRYLLVEVKNDVFFIPFTDNEKIDIFNGKYLVLCDEDRYNILFNDDLWEMLMFDKKFTTITVNDNSYYRVEFKDIKKLIRKVIS